METVFILKTYVDDGWIGVGCEDEGVASNIGMYDWIGRFQLILPRLVRSIHVPKLE